MIPTFSVLMSVYEKEDPVFFKQAVESIYDKQTLKPTEIILIKDGPLTPALNEAIAEMKVRLGSILKLFALEKNSGLGNALNVGLKHCTHELVARMDTDDIALPNRFQVQVDFMGKNPDIDVSGAAIEEFDKVVGDLKTIRFSKENHQDLIRYAKSRNPLNHPSVIFKKSKVLEAGSYMDMPGHEDYYLWVRMILKGARLANKKETLLFFRIGNGMVNRRSGIKYVKYEYRFLKALKELNFINSFYFYSLLLLKIPIRMLPKQLITGMYKILRKKSI